MPKPVTAEGRSFQVWALGALLWGAAEGFLFFIVPDVLISWVALRRGFRAGALACLMAAIGASLGGAAMYVWSVRDPAAALRAVDAVPAVSTPMIVKASVDMDSDGWLVAALKGPLTSTPYKVYAMLAPAKGARLPEFALAALPVRLPRFLFVAGCFALVRRVIEGRVASGWIRTGFGLGWLLFYIAFWVGHPG